MYQNRYCTGSDYSYKGKFLSIKRCADECRGSWSQFLVGTGGNCENAGNNGKKCECYCYPQCDEWKEGNEYTLYTFTEPGES